MRHLIDPLDFTQQEITTLLDLADRIHDDPAAYQDVATHKKLATLFYEPSTRTRLSFEAAMLNLGGHVLGFPSENVSSASKGESVADTIRVVSCYADIVAMRHPKEGAPLRASRYSRIPVINAGDGGHQHPTQTLTDLMTIRRRMGRLDDLTIGLCGDLKFGRTVHSLLKTMPEDEQRRAAVRRLLAYVSDHYAEKLTLENLADYAQYNRTYISTLFKQIVGINFHEYLTRVRFQHALIDLALTTDSLTDIALRNGFADLKTFNARFRTTLQRTPAEYRAQLCPERVVGGMQRKYLPCDDPLLQRKLREYLQVGKS